MLLQFEHEGMPVYIEGFDGDHITRVIDRTHDFFEAEVLQDIGELQPQGAIVDVGAYIGNHSVYFGLFTDAARVIAVEPNPNALELLERNVDANFLDEKIEIVGCAVGASSSSVGLREGRSFNRGHTVITRGSDVQLRTLDDVVGEEEVSVLKIDTEGYELRVLQGASRLMASQSPVIYAEARTRKRKRKLEESLGVFGYKPYSSFNHRSWVHSFKK